MTKQRLQSVFLRSSSNSKEIQMTKFNEKKHLKAVRKTLKNGGALELAPNNFRLLNELINESGEPAIAEMAAATWKGFTGFIKDEFDLQVHSFEVKYAQEVYVFTLLLGEKSETVDCPISVTAFNKSYGFSPEFFPLIFATQLVETLNCFPMESIIEFVFPD